MCGQCSVSVGSEGGQQVISQHVITQQHRAGPQSVNQSTSLVVQCEQCEQYEECEHLCLMTIN